MLLPEGTYYIVSNYGDANSVVRSDVHVQAAKLTDIVVTHRAAVMTFKLVNEKGGEALANTQWTVLTPGGDVIKESIGAFPRVVLAEGDYHLIARNEGRTYQRDFKVIAASTARSRCWRGRDAKFYYSLGLAFCIPKDTVNLVEVRQTEVFARWFVRLRDRRARQRIQARIDRLEIGNPGDARPVGSGVSEMRIDYGPGYRVYFVQRGDALVILLAGGDKRTQRQDISLALKLARDL